MTRVVWSVEAGRDFMELIRYIARRNPHAARHVARRIGEAVGDPSLASTSRRGRVRGTFEKVVRSLPYVVAFAVDETEHGGGARRSPYFASFTGRDSGPRAHGPKDSVSTQPLIPPE